MSASVSFPFDPRRASRHAGALERLRDELRDANARADRFEALASLGAVAAGVVHEVRNPLAAMRLDLQLLAEDCAGTDSEVICTRLGRATVELDRIISDVLLLARELQPARALLDVADLFRAAIAGCAAQLQQHDVQILRRIPDGLGVTGDPRLLPMALTNIVRNAIESVVESGGARQVTLNAYTVRPAVMSGTGHIVLQVADSGSGLDEDVIDKMFCPFFTTRESGTGLGLAIVRRIVEAHDGEIVARNRRSGGAAVELCLPVQQCVEQMTCGAEETGTH